MSPASSSPPPGGAPRTSILDCVGDTPLLALRHVVPEGCGRILVKLELQNPTGSMKDRMALAMIEAAERSGDLRPGGSVVEYTGGSTGVSLAQVCGAKGYRLHVVTSDAFSVEKRQHMRLLGAELTVLPSKDGAMDEALTRSMIAEARRITEETGAYWTDQLNNENQLDGYRRLGEEIWEQTGGEVDAFVHGVGTAGSLMGVSTALRAHRSDLRIIAVEPAESAVLSGRPTGAHHIEGVGAGFVVPLWNPDRVDEITTVATADAMEMTRRLAAEETLFAGTSTGANVLAAIEVARRLGPGSTTVTLACDSGIKYLSTRQYEAARQG